MRNSYSNSINSLNDFLKNYFENQSQVRILEAGCGSATRIERMDKFQITGIDISQKQLDRNNHISKKICGDIQEYKFDAQYFDIIISWYVLEHLKYPQRALKNFIEALKPNGVIILALPNVWSVKGLVTKLTPTIIHIWYYKHIQKVESAGENDTGPFKTYLRKTISPSNIQKFAKNNGLETAYLKFITNENIYKKAKTNPIILMAQEFFTMVVYIISLGRIQKKNHDFIIVLKKTACIRP